MKRLSRELLKSHILLIGMFVSILITAYLYSVFSLMRQSRGDIEEVRTFLIRELANPRHQDLEGFFHGVIMESPKTKDLYIGLIHEGVYLTTPGSPVIEGIPLSPKIQRIGAYDYLMIRDGLITPFGDSIEFTVIRGLHEEKVFLLKKLKIYLLGLLGVTASGYLISRHFYRMVIPQLLRLETITNEVNLHSFKSRLSREDFFQEFTSIISSYEEMLSRLEDQAAVQMDFVNNASHELKTPIFVIGGYVDLIRRWGIEDSEISREAFDFIQSEVKSMGVLIEKLLFLAKEDRIDLLLEEIHLDELVEEVVEEMNIIYPCQSFSLSLSSVTLTSDLSLLKQLIRNLVDNAVKYGEGNTIDITLSSQTVLSIRDRGIGMAKEDLERCFLKFFRADKSRSRLAGGHGLGLAIVRQITDLLQGDIRIESDLGIGSTVTLTLTSLEG